MNPNACRVRIAGTSGTTMRIPVISSAGFAILALHRRGALASLRLKLSTRQDVRHHRYRSVLVVSPLKGVLPEVWLSIQLEDAGKPQTKHKPEEIVAKLRQVAIVVSQVRLVAKTMRSISVTQITSCLWRKEFGGLNRNVMPAA